MNQHTYTLTILEPHIDTFGHVNNAAYAEIFEQARWDLISNRGYGVAQVQEFKKGPVVLEMNLKFLKEIKLRESIKIVSQMISPNSKIMKMSQQMFNSKNELACDALFVFGLMDLKLRKLIEPTPEWLYAIGCSGDL
jgi:YbgC/YbaW family acyl-CoA thioester hydrolase